MDKDNSPPAVDPSTISPELAEVLAHHGSSALPSKGNLPPAKGSTLRIQFDERHKGDSCKLL